MKRKLICILCLSLGLLLGGCGCGNKENHEESHEEKHRRMQSFEMLTNDYDYTPGGNYIEIVKDKETGAEYIIVNNTYGVSITERKKANKDK